MKAFKSLIIVKHPLERVWATVRDRMPEMVPLLDDVASIIVIDRREPACGVVDLVNEWRVRMSVPVTLQGMIKPEMLGWIDRAEWREATHECRWAIEPFMLPDAVTCRGATLYEPALGGRGTRITFTGELDIDRTRLGAIPGALGLPLSAAVEMIVTTLIPRNFRKTTDAVERLLATPG